MVKYLFSYISETPLICGDIFLSMRPNLSRRHYLLGNGCILPPGSVEGYPSPEGPPTPEASEDILHPGSLRANACGGPWGRLMLTTRLVMLSVCRN